MKTRIKTNTMTKIALFVGLSALASASSVYSPGKGVICDKKSGFCTDKDGIALA